MSSILKALKKIETSGISEDTRGPAVPREVQAMLPPRPGAEWYTRRIAWYVLATVLLVAAAAGYYAWTRGQAPSPAAGVAREVRSPLPASPTAPPPLAASRPAARAAGPAAADVQARAASQVQAPPPSSRIRSRESGGLKAAETRPSVAHKGAPPQDRLGAARPAFSRSAADSLERLDESKLRVMAIAWADDPTRRLAVINGHIVREGESVEGYSVTQIRKDDVIVNDGSRSWRVELNLKTQP